MNRYQYIGLALYAAIVLFYAWVAGKALDWVIVGHWYAAPLSILCIGMWAWLGSLLDLLEPVIAEETNVTRNEKADQ